MQTFTEVLLFDIVDTTDIFTSFQMSVKPMNACTCVL